MHQKTILWDNDGVLVDTEKLYLQASREALAPLGVDLTDELYQEISLNKGGSLLDLAFRDGVSNPNMADLRRQRNDRYSELLKESAVPREGMAACLSGLHSKARMGVVTSSLKEHFDVIHQKTGFLKFFDFVLTRDGFDRPKPYPDAYLTALKKWNLKPADCLVVEDTERGVNSATAAGLTCYAFPHALSDTSNLSAATAIFQTASQLTTALHDWIETNAKTPNPQ